MHIHLENLDRSVILRLEGRMDYPTHRDFRDASDKALEAPEVDAIVIDLALVEFMDSAALGMLLLLKEKATLRDRKVILRNPSPTILQVLKMVHFHKFFEIQG
jgi:anti-anti-sigma factor